MSTSPDYGFLLDQAIAYWKVNGLKMTSVRKIICQTAFESVGAFDAEELLQKARKQDGLISLSTVYRTLSTLLEAGLLVEVEGIDRKKCYSVVGTQTAATSHVVCQDCGEVIPVENPCLSLRESGSVHKTGFSPKKMSLRIEATCDELHSCGTCARSNKSGDPHPPASGKSDQK